MRKFLILAISFFSILISTVIAQSIHSNDSEIIAFSFSSNEAIDWGKVKFKIIYKDGNEKIFDHLHGDYEFNQDASSSFVSELFPYSSDVSEIQILSGHNLKIHYFKDRRYLTSDNFPDPDIKRSFFRNLGLDVKLREDWGAPTNSLWQPYIAPHINYFVIHHTVFQNTTDDLSSAVRAIYEYHKIRCVNNSGVYDPSNQDCDEPHELWQDIGYNFLIDKEGNIYEGRAGSLGVTGAHSPPNYATLGIALIGDFEQENPSSKSLASLQLLLARLSDYWQVELKWQENVVGHKNRNATLCPGQNLYSILGEPGFWYQVQKLKNTNQKIEKAINYVDKSLVGENIVTLGDYAEILIRKSTIDQKHLNYISNLHYVKSVKEFKNFYIILVNKTLHKKLLKDILLINENIKIQPNIIYKLETWDNNDAFRALPSDYSTITHWYLEKIKIPEAWKLLGGCELDSSCGGDPNVIVAVIDTGVAYENFDYDAGGNYQLQKFSGFNIEVPLDAQNGVFNEGYDRRYFQSNELSHLNFVSPYDAFQKYICDIRENTSYPCNSFELEKINHANDDDGHGTFVTTIIAGKSGDDSPNKLVGIAHNVSIMPIKPFYPNDSSFCYDSQGNNDPTCSNPDFDFRGITNTVILTDAIFYAVDNGADIINLSLSGKGYDQNLQDAITYAHQNGVIVVASAGNKNEDINQYFPASMDYVISVGATNPDDSKSQYSNFGQKLDLVAPVGQASTPQVASQTLSCFFTNTCSDESSGDIFQNFSSSVNPLNGAGTSFAAPQVSAVVALLKSKNPNMNNRTIEKVITTAIIDLGDPGFDTIYGNGLVNAFYSLNNTWNPWQENGGSTPRNKISSEIYDNKLFQTVLGWDGRIWVRNYDGSSWTQWKHTGGSSKFDPSLKTFDGKLFSAVPGWDGRVWVRSYDGINWTNWEHIGDVSASEITMEVFNSKLYISYIKSNGEIITRAFDGSQWSQPENWGGSGPISQTVGMTVYSGKLYQTVKGWDGRIWVRSYDEISATNWYHTGGSVPGSSNIGVFNSKLFQVVKGWSGKIYFRFGTSENNFSNWEYLPNSFVVGETDFIKLNDKILVSARGTNGSIFLGYITEGQERYFLTLDGETPGEIDLIEFNSEPYITVVGKSRKIFSRNLPN